MHSERPLGHYFEELAVGDVFDCGAVTVTTDAIIRFAMEWDMQPFHVDADAAERSVFGTLVGSGLQSIMLCYRLYFQRALLEGTALAGLGIDGVRFAAPLLPDRSLGLEARVEALRETSRPDRGIVTWRLTGRQTDAAGKGPVAIITMNLTVLVARAPMVGLVGDSPA